MLASRIYGGKLRLGKLYLHGGKAVFLVLFFMGKINLKTLSRFAMDFLKWNMTSNAHHFYVSPKFQSISSKY